MKLEEEIKQVRFKNEFNKAIINIIYTSGWLNNIMGKRLNQYKFAIQWYAAFRAELIRYSQINNNSETSSWDVPLNRYDFVLGYKLNRNTKIKLNGQFTRSPAGKIYDDDIYAIQLALNL